MKENNLQLCIKCRKEVRKMRKVLLGIGTLTLIVGLSLAASPTILAYRGDPNTLGPNCDPERHEQVINAIRNKDYKTWKSLMEGRGVTRKITEQNFTRFAEMIRLRLEGKIDEANKIRTELGLGNRNGNGLRQGQGYRLNSK